MHIPCTGVILAGGLNSRFSGKPKAFLSVRGRRILDCIYDIFNELFDEIILVTNDPLLYCQWDFDIVTDCYSDRSSLTGIHAGLFYSKNPYIFTMACDTPFLQKPLVEAIVGKINPRVDIVTPRTRMGFEPLCAVYGKRCLKIVEAQLDRRRFKVQEIFDKVRVEEIPENELRKIDPELISFFNINTPEDLARAEKRQYHCALPG